MEFLIYPRPIPRITLVAIVALVVVAMAAFIINFCLPSQPIALAGGLPSFPLLTGGEKIAVDSIVFVVELLLLWGLYTGRKLILHLVILKLVVAWFMHLQEYELYQHIMPHVMLLLSWVGLSISTLAVAFLLFVPASRQWFSACEAVRIKRRGGKKFNAWLVTIIIIACVLLAASLYSLIFTSHTNTKNSGLIAGIVEGLPGGLCDGYAKVHRAQVLLAEHGVTSRQECIRLVKPMVDQCASHSQRLLTTKMSLSQSIAWAKKVAQCAALKLNSQMS